MKLGTAFRERSQPVAKGGGGGRGSELIWRTIFLTRAEAKHAIGRYIDGFHNPVRRHSALDFISPAKFEQLAVN